MAGGATGGPGEETHCRLLSGSMSVLAHIHTFNDADIIDRTIEAVLLQTRPVNGILVVDNASTDGTLERPSLKHATVVRHPENLGTSGAVASGFRFALEQDYDWIWILDADSLVRPDALEKLLELDDSSSRDLQNKVAFLACLARNQRDDRPYHGAAFTRYGLAVVRPRLGERHYPCQITIWSGCLYRLAAVRRVGLPDPNYVLDWGEFEYGNRLMKAGYTGFIHQEAILHHNIRGAPSLNPIDLKFGFTTARFYEFPPIRCYYMCRNMLYFTLYDFAQRRSGLVRRVFCSVFKLTVNFLLRPRNHGGQIHACFRGMWHGLTGNIAARY
jgi:GT2 family glycosyltransferase